MFWGGRINLTWMYEIGLTAFLHKKGRNNEISLVYRWKWFARKGKTGESALKNNSCQTKTRLDVFKMKLNHTCASEVRE